MRAIGGEAPEDRPAELADFRGVGGDGLPLFLELVDCGYVRGAGCEDFGERLAAEGEVIT